MFKLFYGLVGVMAFSTGFAAMFVDEPDARGTLLSIAITGIATLLLLLALDRSSRRSSGQS